MNGRVQDPTLGRFLSPDPFVQSPTNSQNFDRFGYTYNNPLSYTDPTGFIFKKIGRVVRDVGRGIRSVAKGIGDALLAVASVVTYVPGVEGGLSFGFNPWLFAAAVAVNFAKADAEKRSRRRGGGFNETGTTIAGQSGRPLASRFDAGGFERTDNSAPRNNPASLDVVGSPTLDRFMIDALSALSRARVEQGFEVFEVEGAIEMTAPRRGSEDEVSLFFREGLVAVGHTHVRSADIATTRQRELPGPGDHLPVQIWQVPNYFRTPSGAIRVVERVGGEYRVRTVYGEDARGQELWQPGTCDERMRNCRF